MDFRTLESKAKHLEATIINAWLMANMFLLFLPIVSLW
jgi:hypothetical protein